MCIITQSNYNLNQPMLTRILFKFSKEVGQQPNNMKRFYKEASFIPNPNKKHPLHNYLITLDGRTVTTPYRNTLAVPSATLAFMISNEFNRQGKYLKTGEMPMIALSRTAIDADIEGHLAEHLLHSVNEYLKTDSLLFVDDAYEPEHREISQPLIDHFSNAFDMEIRPSASIEAPSIHLNAKFQQWLSSLTNWQLVGMQTMTIWMKSTIAAYSDHIQKAAYLQQTHQMRASGEVEEKIMDMNQIKLMVSCGEMMYRWGKGEEEDTVKLVGEKLVQQQ